MQNDNNKEVINSARGQYTLTGVPGINPGIPERYSLSQNYPNPFNPVTVISFDIPKAGHTSLKIYDLLGNLVYTLINGELNEGKYTYNFDGSDIASGTYVFKLESGNFSETKKMVLVK